MKTNDVILEQGRLDGILAMVLTTPNEEKTQETLMRFLRMVELCNVSGNARQWAKHDIKLIIGIYEVTQ